MDNLKRNAVKISYWLQRGKEQHRKEILMTAKGIKVTKWSPLRLQCRDKLILLASCRVWPPKESRVHSLPQVESHSGFSNEENRAFLYKEVYSKELYWAVVIRANALMACLESETGFPMLKLHSPLMVNLVDALSLQIIWRDPAKSLRAITSS